MPAFLCDAMLGGLARWLRAAGYDAAWESRITDVRLLALAERDGRTVLTSDAEFMRRRAVRVPCLFVSVGLSPARALRHCLKTLDLAIRHPRCMSCGGRQLPVDKSSVRGLVGPVAYARHEQFWRCDRCRKIYWQGTHWTHISETLAEAASLEAG